MALKINEKLKFTFPVDTEAAGQVWVHSTPISREVFSAHWDILSETFVRIFRNGLPAPMALRMAGVALRQAAEDRGVWDDAPADEKAGKPERLGVKTTLIAELHRLTQIMMPSHGLPEPHLVSGWNKVPLDEAIKSGTFDEDQLHDIEAILVFFTVASWVIRREETEDMLRAAGSAFGGLPSSLSSTAFRDSLPTSSAAGISSTAATTLSVPA